MQGGNEFVPAVAVQFGGGRHGFPQERGEIPKEPIPGEVPPCIVDPFHAVEIEQDEAQGSHRVEIMGHPHAARLVGVAVAEFGQAVRKGHLVRLLDIVEGILSIPEREHFVRIHDFVRVGQMHVHDMESVANQPIKEGYPLQGTYEQAGFLIGSNRITTEDETGMLILIGDLIGFLLHREGDKLLDLQEFPELVHAGGVLGA